MEQAVILHLRLHEGEFGSPAEQEAMRAFGDGLAHVIEGAAAGEFDGDEFGGGKCTLFMYGPDADYLFKTVEPLLKANPAAAGGCAIKRYGEAGDPNAQEHRVTW